MPENMNVKKAKWHCRNSHNALTCITWVSASEYFDIGSPKYIVMSDLATVNAALDKQREKNS